LIRNLPICEYTFGYSRVSPTPVYTREHSNRSVPMPVRLMAFPPLISDNSGGRSPIYMLEQDNEAFYVRLDEEQVLKWLEVNGVPHLPPPGKWGAAYLEQYEDFKPFMEAYRTREEGQTARTLCSYVYMLLHSISHQMIEALAETSGLDRDRKYMVWGRRFFHSLPSRFVLPLFMEQGFADARLSLDKP
jgi:hypothetical protein